MLDFCINLWYNIRINKMKGYIMNMNKKYEEMKSEVDKLLDKVEDLVLDFDNENETDVSNDLHLTIHALKERIEDNACDCIDFDDEEND